MKFSSWSVPTFSPPIIAAILKCAGPWSVTRPVRPALFRSSCGLCAALFGKLNASPTDTAAVTSWTNQDEAFTNMAEVVPEIAQLSNQTQSRPSGQSASGALPSIWNAPYSRNPNFTGRAEML